MLTISFRDRFTDICNHKHIFNVALRKHRMPIANTNIWATILVGNTLGDISSQMQTQASSQHIFEETHWKTNARPTQARPIVPKCLPPAEAGIQTSSCLWCISCLHWAHHTQINVKTVTQKYLKTQKSLLFEHSEWLTHRRMSMIYGKRSRGLCFVAVSESDEN